MEHLPKRKMKTPTQLEILERVYAEDKYPSELVRSELSVQLGLTDRQVKMWFCHRRLKDRKVNNEEALPPKARQHQTPGLSLDLGTGHLPPPPAAAAAPPPPPPMHLAVPMPIQAIPSHGSSFLDMMQPEERAFHMRQLGKRDMVESRKLVASLLEQPTTAQPARFASAELAAIQLVEEQLGEPLREDGPMLGYEFDPLPPGAFDTPIEHSSHHNENKHHGSRHDTKLGRVLAPEFSPSPTTSSKRKSSPFLPSVPMSGVVPQSPRVPREHQFIPEHPTANQWSTSFPKPPQALDVLPTATKIGSPLASLLPGPGENPFAALPAPPALGLNFPPSPGIFPGTEFPVPRLLPPMRPPMSEKAIAGTERLIMLHEQEQARMERKRKAEEARLAKELEAQEKRLRREAERQESLRRKQKEDQERKELERLNREKQKELERLMRERAREEERLQRQHKREFERMERMMQKEHQRVEKLRQKEEIRREKEATKLRVAYERATAKKLAKLSTGLIDDEQLELMQMGAFVHGLVADSGFDPTKVEFAKFPPASVRMKLPIAVPPWIDSEQNVSNLFMVWRMLTTFADVMGLWPFTLDEFLQALHDYDSRLLTEIHIALLKTLVKDVQEASQAAAIGSNQAATIASGGHHELLEASYSWGFDIQEWGRHLNPLTWPEILRQYALAAGFGPKWKKKSAAQCPVSSTDEAASAVDAVANLRSGAAAESAATQMRGRSRIRKPQKLILTPGTVKYAAFHVLSVEGTKGLSIPEVVDRVQKSGLRDLSTSKTPEASISAVLSRDNKLFERVAPSTYCLRSMYRKPAEDRDQVLASALEKMHAYENRLAEADPAGALEDEIEEDEEEDAEEQDVEEAATRPQQQAEVAPGIVGGLDINLPDTSGVEVEEEQQQQQQQDTQQPQQQQKLPQLQQQVPSTSDGMEIDESQVGELWVQGLLEGEYTDLSVEERLNGLVALVETVNQGHTVRSAIEDRYEAAAALKRQLWEEFQLDKRRLKEELIKGGEAATSRAEDGAIETAERPLFLVQPVQEEGSPEDATERMQQQQPDSTTQRGTIAVHADRSRAQMRADIRLRAEKLYVIRSLPLGLDRRHNRYWQFVTGSQDPGCGRIYFESQADGHWEVIDTEEALNSLMNSLDTRGEREAQLFMALKECEYAVRQAMRASSSKQSSQNQTEACQGSPSCLVETGDVAGSLKVEIGQCGSEKRRALDRYTCTDRWLWSQCAGRETTFLRALRNEAKRVGDTIVDCEGCHDLHWSTELHCRLCHSDYRPGQQEQHDQECEQKMKSKLLPPKLQLLKKLLFSVEMAIPAEAFGKNGWTSLHRRTWCDKLRSASSAGEVLQAFMELESSIDQAWLLSSYETIEQIGKLCGRVQQSKLPAWIPHTTAAVALKLAMLDQALAYTVNEQQSRLKSQYKKPNKASLVQANGSDPNVQERRAEGEEREGYGYQEQQQELKVGEANDEDGSFEERNGNHMEAGITDWDEDEGSRWELKQEGDVEDEEDEEEEVYCPRCWSYDCDGFCFCSEVPGSNPRSEVP